MRPAVAVLFARQDSIYKTMPECDVYDIDRDARTYRGPLPVVAHPPCRAWGGLSHLAKPRHDEKALAPLAVDLVRTFGGVLEHPKRSALWPFMGLPEPGRRDRFGGFTLPIFQLWWGHRAEKATLLYVVGCDPLDVPAMPLQLGEASHVIASSKARQRRDHPCHRPEVTRPEREATPAALAAWLVELAGRCSTAMRAAA